MSLDVHLTINIDTGGTAPSELTLFSANITHNLGEMADEAGIYKCLWRPGEIGAYLAGDIIDAVTIGLDTMKNDPERFRKYDADNGWGTYDDFIPWIEEYLLACKTHPKATIEVSR